MVWNTLQASVKQFFAGAPEEPQLSRRGFLAGMGVFGAVGVVVPGLLAPRAAEAVEIELDEAEALELELNESEAEVIEAGSHDRGRRRGQSRPGRQRGRRLGARQLRQRCQNRSFRRRNRDLCQRALGLRGRRGTCIQIGPLQICE